VATFGSSSREQEEYRPRSRELFCVKQGIGRRSSS
jgi:hypothetical protein